jgi:hypothetical protein
MSPRGGHITQEGVQVTTTALLILLFLGGVGGFYVGRWWAEDTRAEFDMDRIWERRRNYRQSGSNRKGGDSDPH